MSNPRIPRKCSILRVAHSTVLLLATVLVVFGCQSTSSIPVGSADIAVILDRAGEVAAGSILNGGGSYPGQDRAATVADWVALADAYYRASVNPDGDAPAIPVLWGTDAVHGHNNVRGATLFPHNIGLGAARNPELIEAIAEATAREVTATGIPWTFAPTLAVARDDRWGRTYESYSEDPELVRTYAERMVRGLQGHPDDGTLFEPGRVIATAKHWVGDGGTLGGRDQGDTQLDEEALARLHAQGYFSAIEAGVQTVMISYSSWNGRKLHAHRYLITEVLKNRLGFDGLVVSDWDGIFGKPEFDRPGVPGCSKTSCAEAVNAGIDLLMVPEEWRGLRANTIEQVRSGEIPVERIDDAVRRILRVKLRAGLLDRGPPSSQPGVGNADVVGHPDHRALARQAVRESLVLLENDGILPLDPRRKVGVAGPAADDVARQSGGWSVTWDGSDTDNSDFPGATSIWEGIRAAVEEAGGQAELAQDGNFEQQPEVAIVVVGETPYSEFFGDRKDLDFGWDYPNDLAVVWRLAHQGIPVVTVFLSGRPMWTDPLIDTSNAFVAAWLPGTEGAGVADVLFTAADGTVAHDFTGRLSFSWPRRPDQGPLNIGDPEYDPRYAFGYGLDYASAPAEQAPEP